MSAREQRPPRPESFSPLASTCARGKVATTLLGSTALATIGRFVLHQRQPELGTSLLGDMWTPLLLAD